MNNLMSLIIPLFLFSGFVVVIIGGAIYLKREGMVKKSILFVIIGAVEVIYPLIATRIYYLVAEIIGFGYDQYYFIVYTIPIIISINTFGILIIVLGKLNSENSGIFLLISGIFWTIYAAMTLILNLRTFVPFPILDFVIWTTLSLVSFAFMITARILFVIYSVKIGEKVFLVSSIFLLISSATSITLSMFVTFLP